MPDFFFLLGELLYILVCGQLCTEHRVTARVFGGSHKSHESFGLGQDLSDLSSCKSTEEYQHRLTTCRPVCIACTVQPWKSSVTHFTSQQLHIAGTMCPNPLKV